MPKAVPRCAPVPRSPSMAEQHDKELAAYRDLLQPPKEFKDGFGWSTFAGIIFCGLVMLPGSIYLGLMTGGGMGDASTWVTLILFSEIARRSMKTMNKQELVVLLRAAQMVLAVGPFGSFVYRAYLVNSEAVRDAGMKDAFPTWWVPAADSAAILNRDFLHSDWMVPILLALAMAFLGLIKRWTLGYFFFRVTSDIEKLPYPMAPIQAQGALALAEADQKPAAGDAKAMAPLKPGSAGSPRWRQFSLGATVGLAFGMLQVGVPAISGLFLAKPVFLIPTPFLDLTALASGILPATPFGIALDLGVVMLGMVLPFWAVVGGFAAVVLTLVMNPVLHHTGTLTSWQPGMDTVNTTFSNDVDFWLSMHIGLGLAIAIVSIATTVRDMRRKLRELKEQKAAAGVGGPAVDLWAVPEGRGDYPLWIALAGWLFAATCTVCLCWWLLPKDPGLVFFLIFFAFVYSPIISYVNARLMGISGQSIDIPFLKESAFIISGAKGVDIWLAPIPIENFGGKAQALRVNELTGVRMWSLLKTELVVIPVMFLISMAFWAFIWKANAIPSPAFPAAEINWALQAKRDALLYSSTFAPPGQEASILDSQFMHAIHPWVIGTGLIGGIVAFAGLSWIGLPTLFIFGVVRGLGTMPHYLILEIVGALIARYYLERKFGRDEWRRMAPTIMAGYFTGVGLIGMATIALKLIQQAVTGGGL
jgi:hypothetical protein